MSERLFQLVSSPDDIESYAQTLREYIYLSSNVLYVDSIAFFKRGKHIIKGWVHLRDLAAQSALLEETEELLLEVRKSFHKHSSKISSDDNQSGDDGDEDNDMTKQNMESTDSELSALLPNPSPSSSSSTESSANNFYSSQPDSQSIELYKDVAHFLWVKCWARRYSLGYEELREGLSIDWNARQTENIKRFLKGKEARIEQKELDISELIVRLNTSLI